MASKPKKKTTKKAKRSPAQIAATERMLAGLKRHKAKKGGKAKPKKTAKKAASKPKARPKTKKATKTPSTNPARVITTKTLPKGTQFKGWKSDRPGDMHEIQLPENARILVRGKRAVIVTR